jgi:hypothetical protein
VGIESSEASESGYDASPEEGPHYTLRELMDKRSDNSSASSSASSSSRHSSDRNDPAVQSSSASSSGSHSSDSNDPAVRNLRGKGDIDYFLHFRT